MGNENLKVTIGEKSSFFEFRKIDYVNSKDKKVSFKTNAPGIINAFKIIQEELKDKSLFNPSDFPKILQKVETTIPPVFGEEVHYDLNKVMRHAIEDFSKEYSDGGKDITAKEIKQWYERIHACDVSYNFMKDD